MLPGRNLKAYIARFRHASAPELAYRAGLALRIRKLRATVSAGRRFVEIPALDAAEIRGMQLPAFILDTDESAIGEILGGRVFTLGEEQQAVERFERETKDKYFADVRSGPTSPDIRTVWEPARLQHITTLLLYARANPGLDGFDAVRDFARKGLLEWLRKHPFLKGPHYMSPMECGLRIPVFFYALRLLDNLTPEERQEILEALYLHAWWVSRNLSLHSSLGNHTICECVGLVFAGGVFKSAPEGRSWLSKSIELLRQEINHQILDDGGPAEQSLGYHRFVLDLYRLAVGFLERNALWDCRELKPRLELGEAFLATFRDDAGNAPDIGDCDGGHAVAPGIRPERFVER
ncbi:MAG: Heparin-sulfate lyase precursor [Syntrophus sp. PtaB.Bin138]|nr:MAG: Heparin-sulfate lyase precursor [Syntrophus sp. PtaB.Bin138]